MLSAFIPLSKSCRIFFQSTGHLRLSIRDFRILANLTAGFAEKIGPD